MSINGTNLDPRFLVNQAKQNKTVNQNPEENPVDINTDLK